MEVFENRQPGNGNRLCPKWMHQRLSLFTIYTIYNLQSVLWMHQRPLEEKSGGAHINPTATQITWIAFCPVTPTTQTSHKKRSDAAQSKCKVAVQCASKCSMQHIWYFGDYSPKCSPFFNFALVIKLDQKAPAGKRRNRNLSKSGQPVRIWNPSRALVREVSWEKLHLSTWGPGLA